MTGLKLMSACARFSSLLVPYLDGELDPSHAVDVEAHVLACSLCADRVATAREMRILLRRCAERRAPESLRSRIGITIAAERSRQATTPAPERSSSVPPDAASPWRSRGKYIAAIAAAASIATTLGLSRLQERPVLAVAANTPNANRVADLDELLENLVALHARPLPPETTDPEDLQRFDPLVGVPVRRPAFQPFLASFNGARVHAMRDNRVASLQYRVGNGKTKEHRVTIYVFDPRMVSMRPTRLRERVVRERPVYVGTLRGYSIAAAEQRGVGYALASDLGDDESTKLVLSAFQH